VRGRGGPPYKKKITGNGASSRINGPNTRRQNRTRITRIPGLEIKETEYKSGGRRLIRGGKNVGRWGQNGVLARGIDKFSGGGALGRVNADEPTERSRGPPCRHHGCWKDPDPITYLVHGVRHSVVVGNHRWKEENPDMNCCRGKRVR